MATRERRERGRPVSTNPFVIATASSTAPLTAPRDHLFPELLADGWRGVHVSRQGEASRNPSTGNLEKERESARERGEILRIQ